MKITVAGTGYVGLSISVLLAQHNEVWAMDILPAKAEAINARPLPHRGHRDRGVSGQPGPEPAGHHRRRGGLPGADFIVVATPTNYDPDKNYFDTSSVEAVLDLAGQYAPEATVIIKSTVPVGYTRPDPQPLSRPADPVQPGIPAGGPRPVRQPLPQPHRGGRSRPGTTPPWQRPNSLPGCWRRGPSRRTFPPSFPA